MKLKGIFTSESVGKGHPDKICDQISDKVLDAVLAQDPNARVAIETMAANRMIVIGGEMTTSAYVDVVKCAWEVLLDLGYSEEDFTIISNVHSQSPDINQAVDKKDSEELGAGDQGIMFGYATNATPNYMPLPITIAHELVKKCEELRKNGDKEIKSDMKSQVTIDYSNPNKPKIHTVLMSIQHAAGIEKKSFEKKILEKVIEPTVKMFIPDINYKYQTFINPSGNFVIGGPVGDTGLTGRKIIVDTYGGAARHGGGAFCVDGETEYLSRDKNGHIAWKKFKDGYNDEDEVASVLNKQVIFEKPIQFINTEAEKMYHFKTPHSIDMVLSENHDMLFETSKGNFIKKRTGDVVERIRQSGIHDGFRDTIPMSFSFDFKNKGIEWNNDEIRLQVAFCADGTILKNNSNWSGRFNLKKRYKKENLRRLFENLKIEYKESESQDGYTLFYYNPKVLNKNLNEIFGWNINKEQARIICEEVVQWDGNNKNIFRTTNKEDADYIQLLFSLIYSKRVSIKTDNRVGEIKTNNENGNEYEIKSILYEVYITKQNNISLRTDYLLNDDGDENNESNKKRSQFKHRVKLSIEEQEEKKMYCFTTKYGTLLLRRNERIFPTGNCGKDYTKVDRSAAYAARWVAKNLVAAGIADELEIQLAYGIGLTQPISIQAESFGTSKYSEEEIIKIIKKVFDLSPSGIIKALDLKKPIYHQTSFYGHFGRDDLQLPWEKLNKVNEIKSLLKNK